MRPPTPSLLMDAFGLDVILIETVGVGQSEIEVAELAKTTLVALQPGSGDSIQVLKAGIMEIADIFVVNKADHPMANQMRREIRSMMEMLQFPGWVPELVMTQALTGEGIDDLWAAVERTSPISNETGEMQLQAPRSVCAPSSPTGAGTAGAPSRARLAAERAGGDRPVRRRRRNARRHSVLRRRGAGRNETALASAGHRQRGLTALSCLRGMENGVEGEYRSDTQLKIRGIHRGQDDRAPERVRRADDACFCGRTDAVGTQHRRRASRARDPARVRSTAPFPTFRSKRYTARKTSSISILARDLAGPANIRIRAAFIPTGIATACGRCVSLPASATAKQTNERYHFLLSQGQHGLSVAFDMPTLMGYDSDAPQVARRSRQVRRRNRLARRHGKALRRHRHGATSRRR